MFMNLSGLCVSKILEKDLNREWEVLEKDKWRIKAWAIIK